MRALIVREIQRITAESGGRPPGARAFRALTRITQWQWRGVYWARWNDALAEAGLGPNALSRRVEVDATLERLAAEVRRLSRPMTMAEMRVARRSDLSLLGEEALRSRYGTRDGVWAAVAEWCRARPDWADVAERLSGFIYAPAPARAPAAAGYSGSVYLIKSGDFYKIGRSDELNLRVKEITIALPEAASLVHIIRTDDPAGIEAYWHRRFADRRSNGEWFRLSASDVAAFRRRKYQ